MFATRPRTLTAFVLPAPPTDPWTVRPDAHGFPLLCSAFAEIRLTRCKSPAGPLVDRDACWERAQRIVAVLNRIYTS